MPELKMTPWFANGEKPTRKGVYNVSCQREDQSGNWYSYWDGRRFNCFGLDAAFALERAQEMAPRRFYGTGHAVLAGGSWRGLAEKPA